MKKKPAKKLAPIGRVQHVPDLSAPKPEQITTLRNSIRLRQEDAAFLLHRSLRAWEEWEGGRREMPLALWECFTIKVHALKLRDAGTTTDAKLAELGITLPKVEMARNQWSHTKVIKP